MSISDLAVPVAAAWEQLYKNNDNLVTDVMIKEKVKNNTTSCSVKCEAMFQSRHSTGSLPGEGHI